MTLQEANILPGNTLTAVLVTLIEIADTKFRSNRSTHLFFAIFESLTCSSSLRNIEKPSHRFVIIEMHFFKALSHATLDFKRLKGIHFRMGVETFV